MRIIATKLKSTNNFNLVCSVGVTKKENQFNLTVKVEKLHLDLPLIGKLKEACLSQLMLVRQGQIHTCRSKSSLLQVVVFSNKLTTMSIFQLKKTQLIWTTLDTILK